MSQKNPKKMIALFISIAAHAALIYYLGKIALDYALPEGTVSSYEINYEGEQVENVNVDVVSTPPPAQVQPATPQEPAAEKPVAQPAPVSKAEAKPTVATTLPAKEAVSVTENPSAPAVAVEQPQGLNENFIANTPESTVPAVDPFAEDVDKKALENAASETGTELTPPPTDETPVAATAPAEASGAGTTNQAYGRPDGVQSDAVLTPIAGNKSISYPTMARFRKLEGETIVHYTVSGDGAVKDVKLVKSSGHDILDDSVIETVKSWKFKPTGQEGVYERPVKFSLKGDAIPAPSKLRR